MSATPAAIAAQGTKLYVSMGSPATYQEVVNLGDWSPMPVSATEVDVSSHSTTAWDQWVVTLLSGGTPSAPLFYVPSDPVHAQLFTYFQERGYGVANVPIPFRVDFPDAALTTFKFNAFIKEFKIDSPVKGVEKATLTLRITGEPDFNASRT